MKKWLSIIVIAAVVGLVLAFGIGQILPKMRISSSDIKVNISDPELIKTGKYVARTADCVACHTTLGGEEYAGGLPMLTPLGAIYSTNITPEIHPTGNRTCKLATKIYSASPGSIKC